MGFQYILPVIVSPVRKHRLPRTQLTSYQAVSHEEVAVSHLKFRTFSNSVVWVRSFFTCQIGISRSEDAGAESVHL
jgi:hypothetical protein